RSRANADPDFAERPDLEAVARGNQRGRSVFLDQGRTFALAAGCECGAVENIGRQSAGIGPEIDRAFPRGAGGGASTWQMLERRPFEPREAREMQRLELGRRTRIGVAVAGLVVAIKGRADGRRLGGVATTHL